MDRDWPHLDTALSTPASSSTMRLCDRKDFCCDHNEYPFLYPCKKMRLPNRLLSNRVFIMKKVQTDFDRSSASIINDGEASFEGFASVKIPHDEECKL